MAFSSCAFNELHGQPLRIKTIRRLAIIPHGWRVKAPETVFTRPQYCVDARVIYSQWPSKNRIKEALVLGLFLHRDPLLIRRHSPFSNQKYTVPYGSRPFPSYSRFSRSRVTYSPTAESNEALSTRFSRKPSRVDDFPLHVLLAEMEKITDRDISETQTPVTPKRNIRRSEPTPLRNRRNRPLRGLPPSPVSGLEDVFNSLSFEHATRTPENRGRDSLPSARSRRPSTPYARNQGPYQPSTRGRSNRQRGVRLLDFDIDMRSAETTGIARPGTPHPLASPSRASSTSRRNRQPLHTPPLQPIPLPPSPPPAEIFYRSPGNNRNTTHTRAKGTSASVHRPSEISSLQRPSGITITPPSPPPPQIRHNSPPAGETRRNLPSFQHSPLAYFRRIHLQRNNNGCETSRQVKVVERPAEPPKPSLTSMAYERRRSSRLRGCFKGMKSFVPSRISGKELPTPVTTIPLPLSSTTLLQTFTKKQKDYLSFFKRLKCQKVAKIPWLWSKLREYEDGLVKRIGERKDRPLRSLRKQSCGSMKGGEEVVRSPVVIVQGQRVDEAMAVLPVVGVTSPLRDVEVEAATASSLACVCLPEDTLTETPASTGIIPPALLPADTPLIPINALRPKTPPIQQEAVPQMPHGSESGFKLTSNLPPVSQSLLSVSDLTNSIRRLPVSRDFARPTASPDLVCTQFPNSSSDQSEPDLTFGALALYEGCLELTRLWSSNVSEASVTIQAQFDEGRAVVLEGGEVQEGWVSDGDGNNWYREDGEDEQDLDMIVNELPYSDFQFLKLSRETSSPDQGSYPPSPFVRPKPLPNPASSEDTPEDIPGPVITTSDGPSLHIGDEQPKRTVDLRSILAVRAPLDPDIASPMPRRLVDTSSLKEGLPPVFSGDDASAEEIQIPEFDTPSSQPSAKSNEGDLGSTATEGMKQEVVDEGQPSDQRETCIPESCEAIEEESPYIGIHLGDEQGYESSERHGDHNGQRNVGRHAEGESDREVTRVDNVRENVQEGPNNIGNQALTSPTKTIEGYGSNQDHPFNVCSTSGDRPEASFPARAQPQTLHEDLAQYSSINIMRPTTSLSVIQPVVEGTSAYPSIASLELPAGSVPHNGLSPDTFGSNQTTTQLMQPIQIPRLFSLPDALKSPRISSILSPAVRLQQSSGSDITPVSEGSPMDQCCSSTLNPGEDLDSISPSPKQSFHEALSQLPIEKLYNPVRMVMWLSHDRQPCCGTGRDPHWRCSSGMRVHPRDGSGARIWELTDQQEEGIRKKYCDHLVVETTRNSQLSSSSSDEELMSETSSMELTSEHSWEFVSVSGDFEELTNSKAPSLPTTPHTQKDDPVTDSSNISKTLPLVLTVPRLVQSCVWALSCWLRRS